MLVPPIFNMAESNHIIVIIITISSHMKCAWSSHAWPDNMLAIAIIESLQLKITNSQTLVTLFIHMVVTIQILTKYQESNDLLYIANSFSKWSSY